MSWAMNQRPRGSKEKFVLLLLANYASSETGECFPSLSTLADQTRLSRDSVIRAIKALEEDGFVSTKRRKADGVNLPNYYSLNLQGVVAHSDHPSSTMRLGVVAPCDSNLSSEPINEPSPIVPKGTKPVKDRDSDEGWFDEAIRYDYPKKSARLPALRAWLRLSKKDKMACAHGVVDFSLRFDDFMKTAKRPLADELRFVPDLSTFINQRRWELEKEIAATHG